MPAIIVNLTRHGRDTTDRRTRLRSSIARAFKVWKLSSDAVSYLACRIALKTGSVPEKNANLILYWLGALQW